MQMINTLNGLRQDLHDAKQWWSKSSGRLDTLQGRAMYSYMVQLKEKINEIEQSFGTLCTGGSYESHLEQSKKFNNGK